MKIVRMVMVVWVCAVGCATPDPIQETCHRAQDCNDLNAGISESDCVDYFHRCTDNLTSSQRRDWERMMGSCLENESCVLFKSCYDTVPWC